ncbi:MAG TPA: DUF4344 domain-containing metallopeptidase [Pyrinomonadaceae bacterium]
MKKSSRSHLRLSDGRRRQLTIFTALVVAGALLIAGCAKNANTTNTATGSTGNAGSTNSTGPKNREEIKEMADKQGEATAPDKGNFVVLYTPVTSGNEKYLQMEQSIKQERVLEQIVEELNAAIAVPEEVKITFMECGEVNSSWQPSKRTIEMCYELIEYFGDLFKDSVKSQAELEEAVGGAETYVFFHELGHALVDVLNLPSTGKEEDAVDQLSVYILVDSGGDEGEKMALSGAFWWWKRYKQAEEAGIPLQNLNWADEHSMDGARAYNILCWIYGHSPQKYANIVNNPLPEARAVRCPKEYSDLSRAWLTLLKPYLKDGGRKALEATAGNG